MDLRCHRSAALTMWLTPTANRVAASRVRIGTAVSLRRRARGCPTCSWTASPWPKMCSNLLHISTMARSLPTPGARKSPQISYGVAPPALQHRGDREVGCVEIAVIHVEDAGGDVNRVHTQRSRCLRDDIVAGWTCARTKRRPLDQPERSRGVCRRTIYSRYARQPTDTLLADTAEHWLIRRHEPRWADRVSSERCVM